MEISLHRATTDNEFANARKHPRCSDEDKDLEYMLVLNGDYVDHDCYGEDDNRRVEDKIDECRSLDNPTRYAPRSSGHFSFYFFVPCRTFDSPDDIADDVNGCY